MACLFVGFNFPGKYKTEKLMELGPGVQLVQFFRAGYGPRSRPNPNELESNNYELELRRI